MIEVRGDLWDRTEDILCITTNGTVKRNGRCVMGAGCAKQAKKMFPDIDLELGTRIKEDGVNFYPIDTRKIGDRIQIICAFPVKWNWWEKADLALIQLSAINLKRTVEAFHKKYAVIPRPGCGNGGLTWEEVKPVLESVWGKGDERFRVITW